MNHCRNVGIRLQSRNQFNVVVLVVFACTGVVNSALGQSEQRLVITDTGNLPIILSAPHGGRVKIPGVPARDGHSARAFSDKVDLHTSQLTLGLADELERLLGQRPFVVLARFHRRYLDANRPERHALESPAARAVYQQYHRAIESAQKEVVQRWGYGILIDIHGQSSAPHTIFRGTQNGKTVNHLTGRFGSRAFTGDASLFGRLAEQGFRVSPVVGSDDQEDPRYNGGYIVGRHGSRAGGTIDAIQLEVGRSLRSDEQLESTSERLAKGIATFASEFLRLRPGGRSGSGGGRVTGSMVE